jgi:hypothetical protein
MSKRLILTLAMSLLFVSPGISEIFDEKGETALEGGTRGASGKSGQAEHSRELRDMIGA